MESISKKDLIYYLSCWQRTLTGQGDIATFQLDDFTIHLIGKHDIRLTGKGFSGEMRFYDAAKKVMELDKERTDSRPE